MFVSRPAVHPVEAPPLADAAAAADHPPRMRMKDVQGMPGTPGGLALRILQFGFAIASLSVMASTTDFSSVTAFCYLVAAVILQSLWSLSLAFVDIYALLVKRCLRNPRVTCLFAIGDGITYTLTFAAACASAGITVLIGNDLNICKQNHCASFETATAMAFLSWFAVSPSFLLNFWSLASRRGEGLLRAILVVLLALLTLILDALLPQCEEEDEVICVILKSILAILLLLLPYFEEE